MRRHSGSMLLVALLASVLHSSVLRAQFTLSPTPPTTPPVPAPETIVWADEQPSFPNQRLWVNAEYLMWWLNGDRTPPLVTTGTPAAGGVLGPGTQVLFGGNPLDTQGRSGGRITAGYWLDPEQTWALEGSFFMLQSVTNGFAASSPGSPVLARPFYNTLLGQPDAELLALPGSVSGNIIVAAQSSSLLGTDLLLRRNLYERTSFLGVCRVSALAGFRFLDFGESLSIQENLTSLSPTSPAPLGTTLAVGDRFGTRNDFYGGQVGLASQLLMGGWLLNVQGKLGLGSTVEVANISGATTVSVPGSAPVSSPGGLLALSSNSGRYSRQTFSCVPELDLTLVYPITPRWSLTLGYTLMYWSNILRAGSLIDPAINPNQLPPPIPGGDSHPLFAYHSSSLLAEGISVGFLFRY